jgi:hypothetical protein
VVVDLEDLDKVLELALEPDTVQVQEHQQELLLILGLLEKNMQLN